MTSCRARSCTSPLLLEVGAPRVGAAPDAAQARPRPRCRARRRRPRPVLDRLEPSIRRPYLRLQASDILRARLHRAPQVGNRLLDLPDTTSHHADDVLGHRRELRIPRSRRRRCAPRAPPAMRGRRGAVEVLAIGAGIHPVLVPLGLVHSATLVALPSPRAASPSERSIRARSVTESGHGDTRGGCARGRLRGRAVL